MTNAAVAIADVEISAAATISTGVQEVDRVLGGGLVPGGVVLLAGEPGVGKSTLLLDLAARAARTGQQVLYISGEESAQQVSLRAARIRALAPTLFVAAESELSAVVAHVEKLRPALIVVDSVQTITSTAVEGAPGGVAQVKEVAAVLTAVAKRLQLTLLLVGHVTKDGSVAGPRTLEHLVDVVCQFEGERTSRLRLLRAVKNRFGPTDEVGCFDLSEHGITGLSDPSGLFVSQMTVDVPGTCLTVTLEGTRPLVVEVQALVVPTQAAQPRRTTTGVDASRVAMVLAVLQRRAGLGLADQEVYVSTVGGARASEPGCDLALALAVAGSRSDLALPRGLVAIGEVGLAGEIRTVAGVDRRLAEAARLGITAAVVPESAGQTLNIPDGMTVHPVADLVAALAVVEHYLAVTA